MKTYPAMYQGNGVVKLSEDIDLPGDLAVLVVVPDAEDDELALRGELRGAAETVFEKLWDNEEDEIWNDYLQTA